MSQAALLESIPQTKYLSAENYTQYRAIMRLFYREHEKMHYQLDRDTILERLRRDPVFGGYTPEQLLLDLGQLVSWKNLTPIQDPHKAYTVEDFKNRQFQYMMTSSALEIERMTITLENLALKTVGLSPSSFRHIHEALAEADWLEELSAREVLAWWQDLCGDFNRLSQNHQDYLREFYGPGADKQMKSADFIAHKQHLIRYLEEFVRDLQTSSVQIARQFAGFTPERTKELLELVHRSEMAVPHPQAEDPAAREEELRRRNAGVWQSMLRWFAGEDSTARQVMEVTNEIIRRVVQNAALLVQMRSMGVSNKAELRRLLTLFARCGTLEEAHRLSAQVFGAQQARHFVARAARETDCIDSSVYDEPPMDETLQPRIRTYRPRLDRTGFQDKRREKEEQRRAVLEDQLRLRREAESYIHDGALNFGSVDRPVSPEVRGVFLTWVALANLSPDHRARTEYGGVFRLERNSDGACRLPCTDGELTLPDYRLVFEEDAR